jgi:polar amino acid transport system substrate-binding protein
MRPLSGFPLHGVCALLLALALPLAAPSHAWSEGSLRVVTEDWPPYNYTREGEVVGCSTEVVRAVLERAGIRGRFESYAWARAYVLAQTLPNVLIYSIARNAEREPQFHWIGPIGERRLFLYRLAARDDLRVRSIDDLHQYRIGLVRDDFAEHYFADQGFLDNECFTQASTQEQALRMLLAGRVDLVSGTDPVLASFLRENDLPLDRVERVWEIPAEAGYYMALKANSDPELLRRLDKAFRELRDEGRIAEINRACFAPWSVGGQAPDPAATPAETAPGQP